MTAANACIELMIQYLRNCLKGNPRRKVRKWLQPPIKRCWWPASTGKRWGFVQTPGGLEAEALELLTPDGSLLQVPYSETKAVCFVRDFEGGETWREHRTFLTRPKTAGLWVRLRFATAIRSKGCSPITCCCWRPPGSASSLPTRPFRTRRIFVPRAALTEVQVLGVIGSPLRRRPAKPEAKEEGQLEMFDENR